jgi:hypothetical protein
MRLLAGTVTLKVIEGGNHSFKITKNQNQTQKSVLEDISANAVDWMAGIDSWSR